MVFGVVSGAVGEEGFVVFPVEHFVVGGLRIRLEDCEVVCFGQMFFGKVDA